MRHELITVAGMTPQIVTETLWWLGYRSQAPIKMSALHIITTLSAKQKVEEALCGQCGALARLEHDWSIPAPKVNFYVFPGINGAPLDDIRSSADSAAFSAGLAELVRKLTMDTDLALHASIAGGRKTMGFHLGHVMSLFARPQDHLSHVLVPPQFEDCPDFWYPTPHSEILTSRDGRKLDAAMAIVELTEIEHVRLRGRLSSSELASVVSDLGSIFHRAQIAIDDTTATAQTSFAINAVLATSADANTARPLGPVLASLNLGCGFAVRLSVRPNEVPALSVHLDVHARSVDVERAKIALRATAADIRHAIDLDRTGYRLLSDGGEVPQSQNPLWTARLLPLGPIICEPSNLRGQAIGFTPVQRKLSILEQNELPVVRALCIGKSIDPQWRFDLPVSAIVQTEIELDLIWTIDKMQLEAEEIHLLESVRETLERGTRSASGDLRVDAKTILSRADEEAAVAALQQWAHQPNGFRATVTVRAGGPLPDALLTSIGQATWGGRPFRIATGDSESDRNAPPLNLADCFSAAGLLPFNLPSTSALRAAGYPTAWPTAPRSTASTGVALGASGARSIRITRDDRARHLYAIGATGTGKSTFLRNLILQDIEAGEGVFVLDPHGDLVDDVARQIPIERTSDVILLDAGDIDFPVGLNFLQIDPQRRDQSGSFAISELLAIFWRLYKDIPESIGPAFEQYFTVVLKLLVENDAWTDPSLLDIARVLSDRDFRDILKLGCPNPAVQDVLDAVLSAGGDASWENIAPYITNKLNRLTLNPLFRNIFCQIRSTVDFRAALDDSRIVLVKLPKGRLPEMDVRLLGMLILGKLFGAALGRDDQPAATRKPTYVYIDEFQNFVTGTVGQMMAEARKYGLSLTLANQNLAQLDQQLRETVLGNVASLFAFRVGPSDAEVLAPFFAPALGKYDLQALANYHCATRVLSNGSPVVPPFIMVTEPPRSVGGARASMETLIAASRQNFARPRADVEAEITARYKLYGDKAKSKRR